MNDTRALSRRLGLLVPCVGIIAACSPTGPAVAPAPTPVRRVLAPRVVPEPVSQTFAGGEPFVVTGSTSIVADPGNAEVSRVANQLAALLRPATAFAVPIASSGAGAPGAIALRLISDPALGAEGYQL